MGIIRGSLVIALVVVFVICFSGAVVLYSFSSLTNHEVYKKSLEENDFYGKVGQTEVLGEIGIEIPEERIEEIVDQNIGESLDYINGETGDLNLVVELEREDLESIIENELDDKEICLENQNYLFNGEIICKPESFTAEEVANLYLNRQGIEENETLVIDVGENLGLTEVAEKARTAREYLVSVFYVLLILSLISLVVILFVNLGNFKKTMRSGSYALLISGFLTFAIGFIFYKAISALYVEKSGAFRLFSNVLSDILSSVFLKLGYNSLFVLLAGLAMLAVSIVMRKK